MNLLTALSAVEPSFSIVPTRRQNHQESIRSWCQTMITRKSVCQYIWEKKPYKPTLTASNASVGWNLICVAIFLLCLRQTEGGRGAGDKWLFLHWQQNCIPFNMCVWTFLPFHMFGYADVKRGRLHYRDGSRHVVEWFKILLCIAYRCRHWRLLCHNVRESLLILNGRDLRNLENWIYD